MILSKKICISCYKKQNWKWARYYEFHWKGNDGRLWCVINYEFRRAKFNPPDNCPFYLEHFMEFQNDCQV